MAHTWVDGEVITAEKLNQISKEPLVIDIGDVINTNIYFKYADGELSSAEKYVPVDYTKYLNIYIMSDGAERISAHRFYIYDVYPCNTNEVTLDSKCIIKQTKVIELEFYNNYSTLIVNPTVIADGTALSDK